MPLSETSVAPRPGDTPEAALGRMRRLLDVCLTLNAVRDLDRLLNVLAHTTTRVLRCEAASVLLYDETQGVLRFAAATGSGSEALVGMEVPVEESLAGTIFRENRPLLAVDLARDGRHFAAAASQTGVRPETLLGVPMRLDDRPVGVLEALNPLEASFDRADAESLLVIAAQAAVALRAARQQAALAEANARLERLDATRAQFLTLASHELRTPLTAIRGYADVLADEVPGDLVTYVEEVQTAGRQMQEIVETVEEMAWLRSDGRMRDAERIGVAALLDEVCTVADRGVTLDVAGDPCVQGDRIRLLTALAHLVRNAARFTSADGTVAVTACTDGPHVRVSVADTGRGLAPEHLERVFDPFFQVEAPDERSHEGLGVGLAIARAVAERHGGALWAASDGLGRGATFHLRLPRAA